MTARMLCIMALCTTATLAQEPDQPVTESITVTAVAPDLAVATGVEKEQEKLYVTFDQPIGLDQAIIATPNLLQLFDQTRDAPYVDFEVGRENDVPVFIRVAPTNQQPDRDTWEAIIKRLIARITKPQLAGWKLTLAQCQIRTCAAKCKDTQGKEYCCEWKCTK